MGRLHEIFNIAVHSHRDGFLFEVHIDKGKEGCIHSTSQHNRIGIDIENDTHKTGSAIHVKPPFLGSQGNDTTFLNIYALKPTGPMHVILWGLFEVAHLV